MKNISLILSAALFGLTLAACSNSSSSQNTTAGNPTLSNAEAKCRKQGGEWTRGGTLMFYGCLRPSKDAGKSCTDSTQCEFHCNARPGQEPQPGQRTTGQCQANNSYKGCHIEISNGVAKPLFCSKI